MSFWGLSSAAASPGAQKKMKKRIERNVFNTKKREKEDSGIQKSKKSSRLPPVAVPEIEEKKVHFQLCSLPSVNCSLYV